VKSLDESGHILIVSDRIYLGLDLVARVMESIMSPLRNPRREDPEKLEKQKAEIDAEIDAEPEKKVQRAMVQFRNQLGNIRKL